MNKKLTKKEMILKGKITLRAFYAIVNEANIGKTNKEMKKLVIDLHSSIGTMRKQMNLSTSCKHLSTSLTKNMIAFEYSEIKRFLTLAEELQSTINGESTKESLIEKVETLAETFTENKTNKFEVGQVLYNHGDMANNAGWYEIVTVINDNYGINYDIKEIGEKMRTLRINEQSINIKDWDNGLTRIVTKEARMEKINSMHGSNLVEKTLAAIRKRQLEKKEILSNYSPDSNDYKEFKNMYLSDIKEILENRNDKKIEEQKQEKYSECTNCINRNKSLTYCNNCPDMIAAINDMTDNKDNSIMEKAKIICEQMTSVILLKYPGYSWKEANEAARKMYVLTLKSFEKAVCETLHNEKEK